MEIKPLFGQRYQLLRDLVAEGGACQDADSKLREALDRLGPLIEQRNCIVHSTGTVYIDGAGRWLRSHCFRPNRKNAPDETGFFTQEEAEAIEKDLRHASRRLISLLRLYEKKLRGD